jgi:hypothetical protein
MDLESFLWVLIWAAVHYNIPNKITICWHRKMKLTGRSRYIWDEGTREEVGSCKRALMRRVCGGPPRHSSDSDSKMCWIIVPSFGDSRRTFFNKAYPLPLPLALSHSKIPSVIDHLSQFESRELRLPSPVPQWPEALLSKTLSTPSQKDLHPSWSDAESPSIRPPCS